MTDSIIEERAAIPKVEEWAERIAAQQRSGITVKQFCKEEGLTESAPEERAGTFRFGG